MIDSGPPARPSSTAEARTGFVAILPILVAAAPFGILIGAMAAQKGLLPWQAALMSASVFAGAAQFIAIDMWTSPVPILALALATLVVNLRHVLMGASLARHMHSFGPVAAPVALFLMTDEGLAPLSGARWSIRRAGVLILPSRLFSCV
jgi:predicted branched-subunit amino acid permease